MSNDYAAQGKSCAQSNIVYLNTVSKQAKRCRPRKLGTPTPATETFDLYAEQISKIPMDVRSNELPLPTGVRGWNAAKDYARDVIRRDARLSRAAVSVANFLIDKINHSKGYDWHSIGHIAEACGLAPKTVSDALTRLRITGHTVRRKRQLERGSWDRWETTLPTLARAAVVTGSDDQKTTRQSTGGYPSIDGGVPVDRRGGATRRSTELTCSLTEPTKKTPPHARSEGAALSVESEVGARSASARKPASRFVEGADGRLHFNESSALESKVTGQIIDGYTAEVILTDARNHESTCDPRHVRSALLAATKKFADLRTAPSLHRIVEWSRDEAARLARKDAGKDPTPSTPSFWWRGKEAEAREYPDEVWENAIREQANGVWPVEYLGPPPGQSDCLVPIGVIRRFKLLEKYGPSTVVPHPPKPTNRPQTKPYWWRGHEEAARQYGVDVWEAGIRQHANGVWPVEYLGPLPGTPECLVPYPLIVEFDLLEKYGPKETSDA